jgi:hypothetical protein
MKMNETTNASDPELVHFDGFWDASEREQLAATIRTVEHQLDLETHDEWSLGAPWIAAATDLVSSERLFTVHRQHYSQVLAAHSLNELTEQIQALAPHHR